MQQCPYITTKSWYKGTVVATTKSKRINHKDECTVYQWSPTKLLLHELHDSPNVDRYHLAVLF